MSAIDRKASYSETNITVNLFVITVRLYVGRMLVTDSIYKGGGKCILIAYFQGQNELRPPLSRQPQIPEDPPDGGCGVARGTRKQSIAAAVWRGAVS